MDVCFICFYHKFHYGLWLGISSPCSLGVRFRIDDSSTPEKPWIGPCCEHRPTESYWQRSPLPSRPVQCLLLVSLLSSEVAPATVTMLLEPNKDLPPKIASNLQPMSLISAWSKDFECLIQQRILDCLIPDQFIFCAGHSSTHQLMRSVEMVAEAGCSRAHTIAIFL